MDRRMVEARVERGRRVPGRRLRTQLIVMAAFAATIAWSVPALAASGGAGPGSSQRGPASPQHSTARMASGNSFGVRGMWIWVLTSSNGGNLSSIVAQARRYGVSTLMIKSGDGTSTWSQFNSGVVSALHANGMHVCGWQYVYGNHPISEAYVGAAAVKAGADCLLIDAESEYEGKYVQAQSYIGRLRALIGPNFPVALAGFPYMDFHPGFPYSVFLGPGAAQYNVPQMYWRDIGTSVDAVFAHTFVFNQLYRRPIFPLGQVYNAPPPGQILRFRQISRAYGSPGLSWWDWQEASSSDWRSISQPIGKLTGFLADTAYATVGKGARGDLVVWAQEHLVSAGAGIGIDGAFGPKTLAAVDSFQAAHGLTVTGLIDTGTWQALLRYAPARVTWAARGSQLTAKVAGGRVEPVPTSARLRAKHDEIPPSFGSGRP